MKVSLNDIRPPIWRRVQTKDCTLFKLHKVIQASLGWEDYHLHRCDIGGQPCGQKRERTVLLSEIVAQGIAEVGYCYLCKWQLTSVRNLALSCHEPLPSAQPADSDWLALAA